MPSSFKALQVISTALKIFTLIVIILMGVAFTAILVAKEPEIDSSRKVQLSLNLLFSGSLISLVLYAIADMIRILLQIHKKLTGSSS